MPQSPRRDLDSPWKEALQYFLPHFLAFFFPQLHIDIAWSRGYEALDKEFQQIIRDAKVGKRLADKLFKVWLKTGQEAWLLLHVEIQGGVEADFAERMFQYNYRCYELFHRRVISLAVLCDDQPGWRPRQFTYGGWGSEMGLRFPSAKLLDYAGQETTLAASDNPMAQVVLAHLTAQQTRQDPRQRQHWKLRLVKGLYEHRWVAEDIRQLFRVLDWMLELPTELQHGFREELHRYEEEQTMPYVTSIERLAIEEGREQGQKEALVKTIHAGLKNKFGNPGLKLMPKVRALDDLAQLYALTVALVTADDLQTIRDLLR